MQTKVITISIWLSSWLFENLLTGAKPICSKDLNFANSSSTYPRMCQDVDCCSLQSTTIYCSCNVWQVITNHDYCAAPQAAPLLISSWNLPSLWPHCTYNICEFKAIFMSVLEPHLKTNLSNLMSFHSNILKEQRKQVKNKQKCHQNCINKH